MITTMPVLDVLEAAVRNHVHVYKRMSTKSVERRVGYIANIMFQAQKGAVLRALDLHRAEFPLKEAQSAGWVEQALTESSAIFHESFSAALHPAIVAGQGTAVSQSGILPDGFSVSNQPAIDYLANRMPSLIEGLDATSASRLGNYMADARERGLGAPQMTSDISSLFDDFSHDRARSIAITETARAYEEGSASVIGQLKEAGLFYNKSWLASTIGACNLCGGNEGEGPISSDDPHQSGDDYPPAHSNCRCTETYERVDNESDVINSSSAMASAADDELLNFATTGFTKEGALDVIRENPGMGLGDIAKKLGIPSNIASTQLGPILRAAAVKGEVRIEKRGRLNLFHPAGEIVTKPPVVAPPIAKPAIAPPVVVEPKPRNEDVFVSNDRLPTNFTELTAVTKKFLGEQLTEKTAFTSNAGTPRSGFSRFKAGGGNVDGVANSIGDIGIRPSYYHTLDFALANPDAISRMIHALNEEIVSAAHVTLHEFLHTVHHESETWGGFSTRDSHGWTPRATKVSVEGMNELATKYMIRDYLNVLFGPEKTDLLLARRYVHTTGYDMLEVKAAEGFSTLMSKRLGMTFQDFVKGYVSHGYEMGPMEWVATKLVGEQKWYSMGSNVKNQYIRNIVRLMDELANPSANIYNSQRVLDAMARLK